MGARATTSNAKAMARAMWALGDYHRFARALVWEVGPVLVDACGSHRRPARPRRRRWDGGDGAIRAAERGADVVASDLTPENFAAGRDEATRRGVALEWVEGDAESLPFGDASFDVVTSCFGAMFALDHETVASELVRVCRPGGTIGLASFTPRGTGARVLRRPRPARAAAAGRRIPPVLWGDEEHVRSLFRDRVASLDLQRRTYTERAASPADYRRLFEETFGPLIALRAALATDLDRAAALDRDFADFTERANEGPADGPAEYVYEYSSPWPARRDSARPESARHDGGVPSTGGIHGSAPYDRVAIVTGASRELGAAMAAALAGSGAAVVVAHHGEPDRAADVVAGIGAAGGVAVAFDGDLATVAANERLVSFAARELGRVDVFVANAGLTRWRPFLEMDEATWDEVVDLNLKGSYFGAQAAARRMVEQGGGGRIVLSSSVTGTIAAANLSAYSVTKAGLAHMARVLALELGPHGITVNALGIGATVNERNLGDDPDYAEHWAAVTPTGRVGEPRDVAAALLYLVSPAAAMVNGHTLTVDGGWSAVGLVPG